MWLRDFSMIMSCSKAEKLNKLWLKYCLGQGNLERNSDNFSNQGPPIVQEVRPQLLKPLDCNYLLAASYGRENFNRLPYRLKTV